MIAIIPAGGKATRIHGIPKYLLPTHKGTLLSLLIGKMQRVHPREIVIMTKGINATLLRETAIANVSVVDRDDSSMTHAVIFAREYAMWGESAIFGMPDTYFDDFEAFPKLHQALGEGADVAVGVFPVQSTQKRGGMCRIEGGRVVEVIDKPETTDLEYIWGVLAWKPLFWECLRADEPHVGYGLPRAIERGLDVRAVMLDGLYFDAGTFEEYSDLLTHLKHEVARA